MSNKLHACKACGQTIARNAKVCPHCGAKNKKRHPILLMLLLIIAAIIVINLLNDNMANNTNNHNSLNPNQTTEFTLESDEKPSQTSGTLPLETTISTEEPVSTTESVAELVDGMHPGFKEAMDGYEAFFKEYCDFMVKYQENSTDLDLLADYTAFMSQYIETMSAMKNIDDTELNDAELKYYMEVTSRITKMLIDITNENP